MKERFKAVVEFIETDIDTAEYKTRKQKTIQLTLLLFLFVTAILALFNLRAFDTAYITPVSVAAVAVFLVACFMSFFLYDEKIVHALLFFGFILLFSYILITGSSEGLSIYWILVLPMVYMGIIDFKWGLYIGAYFLGLSIIYFYTPIGNEALGVYSEHAATRFPFIYFWCYMLAIVIGVKNKKALLEKVEHQKELERAVIEERRRVQKLSVEAITSITNALDTRDNYTHRHSEHVAFYSKEIGRAYGISGDDLEELYTAARLHDLGKIGVPDDILNKKSGLTDEEYEIVKSHVVDGSKILKAFDSMPNLDVGALYHHERYDGSGYIKGLKGDEIPLYARIIAVADAMDAMYSKRVYREKSSKEYVIFQLREGAGSQFDPVFANLAIELIEDGMLERMEEEFKEN